MLNKYEIILNKCWTSRNGINTHITLKGFTQCCWSCTRIFCQFWGKESPLLLSSMSLYISGYHRREMKRKYDQLLDLALMTDCSQFYVNTSNYYSFMDTLLLTHCQCQRKWKIRKTKWRIILYLITKRQDKIWRRINEISFACVRRGDFRENREGRRKYTANSNRCLDKRRRKNVMRRSRAFSIFLQTKEEEEEEKKRNSLDYTSSVPRHLTPARGSFLIRCTARGARWFLAEESSSFSR